MLIFYRKKFHVLNISKFESIRKLEAMSKLATQVHFLELDWNFSLFPASKSVLFSLVFFSIIVLEDINFKLRGSIVKGSILKMNSGHTTTIVASLKNSWRLWQFYLWWANPCQWQYLMHNNLNHIFGRYSKQYDGKKGNKK